MVESKPLIVQSDLTVLLDVHDPAFEEGRAAIGVFAALEKSPEHLHTYRISPMSLWNAASAGLSPPDVEATLLRYSRYEVPRDVSFIIRDTMSRFGRLVLKEIAVGGADGQALPDRLLLSCADAQAEKELGSSKKLQKWLEPVPGGFEIRLTERGTVKRELLRLGWPVKDEAILMPGDPLAIKLRDSRASGGAFGIRPYQADALAAFVGGGLPGSGYGVVVMPCGAGKTIVAMAVMVAMARKTLIVTTNIAAVHQWMDELADKTDLPADCIGEYTGAQKTVKPVTIATYQILTWRPDKDSDFPHFDLFRREKWGLIIYDVSGAPTATVGDIKGVCDGGAARRGGRGDGFVENQRWWGGVREGIEIAVFRTDIQRAIHA